MAGKDIIEMSQRELRRLHVIRKAIEGILKQKEAGELLSLSDDVRRLIKKVRLEGDVGIIHKARGKPSNSNLPKKIKDKAIKFYRKSSRDLGRLLQVRSFSEMEGIKISKDTLRKNG